MDAIKDDLCELFTVHSPLSDKLHQPEFPLLMWKKITGFAFFCLVDLKRYVDRINLPCSQIITTDSEKMFV